MSIIVEVMVGLSYSEVKCSTKYFPFKTWFDLKMSIDDVMNVGADFICLFYNKTKMFCKVKINKTAKNFPEGYNLLLNINPMVP